MDTVQEETVSNGSDSMPEELPPPPSTPHHQHAFCSQPPSRRMTGDSMDLEGLRHISNSRRPSAIIAALRRPSQALALSAAHTVISQNNLVTKLLHTHPASTNQRLGDDALTIALSALYAKLLVVLGVAFPVTEIIATKVPKGFYQGFFLYLYSGSVFFVAFIYATLLREKVLICSSKKSKQECEKHETTFHHKRYSPVKRYGSFYLRLGAIAFGIGSMVYSALDFGQYFELKKESNCNNVIMALTPAARMILTMVQMQFIFLNSKEMELNRYKIVARFGIMHMIATNVCEWLYVLVEETEHEIVHLNHKPMFCAVSSVPNVTAIPLNHTTELKCKRTDIMGSLVQNASPFLFPCTIEYSLICAVILFEMWKNIKRTPVNKENKKPKNPIKTPQSHSHNGSTKIDGKSVSYEKLAHNISLLLNGRGHRSSHHFSVDCAGAHRGIFGGILVIVMTIISLIMFFVLNSDPVLIYTAIFEVNVCEVILYIVTSIGVVIAMIQMRDLKYHKKKPNTAGQVSLNMNTTLLVMAQSGVFIYSMFSLIGCHFTMNDPDGSGFIGLAAELLSLIQTILQTQLILDAWCRRCCSSAQARRKPGRQLVTFLLVANMAMWTINSLEKNRAEFRPAHLKFFGVWAWTTITHVSMPLAIFYRFHSSICLFEIWKSVYKMKISYH